MLHALLTEMNRRRFLGVAGGLTAMSALPAVSAPRERRVKMLQGLRASPIQDDNLHLGCIKGALDFLGVVSRAVCGVDSRIV